MKYLFATASTLAALFAVGCASEPAAQAPVGVTEAQPEGQPLAPAGQAIILSVGLLFPKDGAALSSAAKSKLDDVADTLHAHPKAARVVIQGYTDDTVAGVRSAQLSRERARNVADYLWGRGIARNQVTTQGLGGAQGYAAMGRAEAQGQGEEVTSVEIVVAQPVTSEPGKEYRPYGPPRY
ncbi:MAG: OmpA family protein [Polyangiaceae bacterium]